MKVLIINSGRGSRMGELTANSPKCLTKIYKEDTILGRQLRQLVIFGLDKVVITTGYCREDIIKYCKNLNLPLDIKFVNNDKYDQTNYIYSIYLALKDLDDDVIIMHGDLVMQDEIFKTMLQMKESCMATNFDLPLPEKDFKAVVKNNKIVKIGVEFFENAVAAQPIYKLNKADWLIWAEKIKEFCEKGNDKVYAENAFNDLKAPFPLLPVDFKNMLVNEIDNPDDLKTVNKQLEKLPQKTVYISFSTDILHSGHLSLIKKAAMFGKVIVGVLTDKAVASYKRFPMVPFEERKFLFNSLTNVSDVIEQKDLCPHENLKKFKFDYVVHGDDWRQGVQAPVRAEVIEILESYGGKLIEFPYNKSEVYSEIESTLRKKLSLPDIRRSRLKKLLSIKPIIRVIEAHNGITGLIVENTVVNKDCKVLQFDGMWLSSLCDSTMKGKPDIELVDFSSRFKTIDEIMEVTTKPIILDGDTGGKTEHFTYLVRTLERMGVSAVIIEDKIGLKKNSLFGTEVDQTQDSIENFSHKIKEGKKAQKTKEFMIIARIESLILEKGMEDALNRAFAFTKAGADGIMIHSRKKDPAEIFEFVTKFRQKDYSTPIVVVPTSFNSVTEDEFEKIGVNIVIYANHLIRSGIPAMKNVAKSILLNQRAKEADDLCMPIKEIINFIPEE